MENQKKIMNLSEVAAYTGISKAYMYKLTSQRLIPHSKPLGKLCFFNRDDIDKWLQSNPVVMQSKLSDQAATASVVK